jgi:tripartite-type tricarboxylate transporter receptor subunit TctC
MALVNLLRGFTTAALLIGSIASGKAKQWPTRPIKVVSPFPAGSASDTRSRVVIDQMSQLLGRPTATHG